MILTPPPRRPAAESIVPMINVVFLLLIFFLMTAVIAPPDPVNVTPPVTDAAGQQPHEGRLYLGQDGTLVFGDQRGEAAVAAAATAATAAAGSGAVTLMADAGVDGAAVARLLSRLAILGVPQVRLIATPGTTP